MLDVNIKKWMKFMFEHKDQFLQTDESLQYKIEAYPNVKEQEKDNDLFAALSLILNNCNTNKEQKGVTQYNKKFPFKCDKANFLDILNYQKKYTGTVDTMVQKSMSYMPGHYYKTFPKMISTAFETVRQSYRTERAINIWQQYFNKEGLNIDAKELIEKVLKEQQYYIKVYAQFNLYNSGAWANALKGVMNVDAHALYTQDQKTMIGVIVHELYHDFDERMKDGIMRNSKGVVDLPGDKVTTTGAAQAQETKYDPSFYMTKGGDVSRFSTRRYPTHESSIFLRGIEDILTPQARASLTKVSMPDPRYPKQRFQEYELDPTEIYVRLKKLQNRLGDKEGYITFEKLKKFLNDKNPNKYGADYDVESVINNLDTSSDEKIRKIIDFLNKRVAVAPTQQRTQVAENKKNMKKEWSEKYKRSIDCKHPKGFSQRAHCQGRKKNEEIELEEKRKLGKPSSETNLGDWFKRKGAPGKKGGWVDCNTCRDGKCSPCGRQGGEKRSKYPRCRPTPAQCKGYKRRGDNLQKEEEQ